MWISSWRKQETYHGRKVNFFCVEGNFTYWCNARPIGKTPSKLFDFLFKAVCIFVVPRNVIFSWKINFRLNLSTDINTIKVYYNNRGKNDTLDFFPHLSRVVLACLVISNVTPFLQCKFCWSMDFEAVPYSLIILIKFSTFYPVALN